MNKREIVKHLLLLAVALSISAIYILPKDLKSMPLYERYRVLADGFTIPGLLLVCFGLLLYLSNLGALDGFLYGVRTAVNMLLPIFKIGHRSSGQESYGEYLERRKSNRIHGYAFILHVGILLMIIAVYFILRFDKVYN